MFERKGTFYALFDHCCCFCGGGSGAVVHTLRPWTNGSQIGAYDNGRCRWRSRPLARGDG